MQQDELPQGNLPQGGQFAPQGQQFAPRVTCRKGQPLGVKAECQKARKPPPPKGPDERTGGAASSLRRLRSKLSKLTRLVRSSPSSAEIAGQAIAKKQTKRRCERIRALAAAPNHASNAATNNG